MYMYSCSTLIDAQGGAGTCVNFQAEGKQCVDMGAADLEDPSIPDTYKCGDVIRKDNAVVMVDRPAGAACIEGVCRYVYTNEL